MAIYKRRGVRNPKTRKQSISARLTRVSQERPRTMLQLYCSSFLDEASGHDSAGPLARWAQWARLKSAIDVDVHLLVVEGETALDLGALELRGAVPPHEVLQDFTCGKLDVVIARDAL